MLGIIIGIGSVIAMLAIGQGSKKSIEDQVSGMGSNLIMIMPGTQAMGGVKLGNDNSQKLTTEDITAISNQCSDISMVSPEVRGAGQVIFSKQNAPTTIYGGNTDYLDIKKIKIKSGRIFTEKEIRSAAKVCLLGKTVIKNIFGENVDPTGSTIRFKRVPLLVIGVLDEKGQSSFGQDQDDIILAPYTTVQKRILAITHVQTIVASAISEKASDNAVSEIESVLRERHKIKSGEDDDFTVRTQAELIKTFSSISDVLTLLLGAIAGISLLVGGIGIMNIMYVSVTERTREIGLRMAIGAKGHDILMQFLTEAILLSVFGGIIGILLGVGASKLISSLANWPVVVTTQSIVVSFAVCTGIGIFFGWYPANKASKLDPIDALRYE
jgi:putative ABC transport system permease protein